MVSNRVHPEHKPTALTIWAVATVKNFVQLNIIELQRDIPVRFLF